MSTAATRTELIEIVRPFAKAHLYPRARRRRKESGMSAARTEYACMKAADANARFDWDRWNADLDAALDAALKGWNDAERGLSEAHIEAARDIRDALPKSGDDET